MRVFRLMVTLGLTATVLACGEPTGTSTDVTPAASGSATLIGNNGEGFGNHEPISADPLGPALEGVQAEFWAVQGKQRAVVINYVKQPDERSAEVFLRLSIPAKAQLVAPDGRRLARGDSLLIRVHIVPGKLAAQFFPHGLVFADSVPAELAISYRYGETRARPVDQLGMWYLSPEIDAADKQLSRLNVKDRLVVARIYHFSNYAVAY